MARRLPTANTGRSAESRQRQQPPIFSKEEKSGHSPKPAAAKRRDRMEKEKISRINELARKSKLEPLTAEELAEQAALRQEYIAEIRASFGATLDATVIRYPDGSSRRLKSKKDGK